jgi:hypothetical protein
MAQGSRFTLYGGQPNWLQMAGKYVARNGVPGNRLSGSLNGSRGSGFDVDRFGGRPEDYEVDDEAQFVDVTNQGFQDGIGQEVQPVDSEESGPAPWVQPVLQAGGRTMYEASKPGATFAGSLGAGIMAASQAAERFAERQARQQQLEAEAEYRQDQLDLERAEFDATASAQAKKSADILSAKQPLNDLPDNPTDEQLHDAYMETGHNLTLLDFPEATQAARVAIEFAGKYSPDTTLEWETQKGFDSSGNSGVWRIGFDPTTGEVKRRTFSELGDKPDRSARSGFQADKDRSLVPAVLAGIEGVRKYGFAMTGRNYDGKMTDSGWEEFTRLAAASLDGETSESPRSLLGRMARSKFKDWLLDQDDPVIEAMFAGRTAALQAINPMVRFLSGAQMTNDEAGRYYRALIPGLYDTPEEYEIKLLGLELMAQAMDGRPEMQESSERAFRTLGGETGGALRLMSDRETDPITGEYTESIERYENRTQQYGEAQAQQIYARAKAEYDRRQEESIKKAEEWVRKNKGGGI